MARKMTEWPSKRGPITKIMPSDGCKGDTVPLAVGKWYEFHEFGWYTPIIGENILSFRKDSHDLRGIFEHDGTGRKLATAWSSIRRANAPWTRESCSDVGAALFLDDDTVRTWFRLYMGN